jgi:hypothetical protein
MQSDTDSSRQATHEIIRDAEYYATSPAQARPPDGTFPAGTKVSLESQNGSYSRVTSADGISAYVASDAIKPLDLKKG